jgi:hypothetical protein
MYGDKDRKKYIRKILFFDCSVQDIITMRSFPLCTSYTFVCKSQG